MKPWRYFASAVIATPILCSLILLRRHYNARATETRVRNVLAQANAGLAGAPDRDQLLRTNNEVVSQVNNALAGVNDYLWAEAGQLRGSKDVHVSVDAHVQKVVFGVTGILRKPSWNLQDPRGQIIDAHRAQGERLDLAEGSMLILYHPQVGLWTLHVTAQDHIFLFARAASNTGFDACELGPHNRMNVQISAEGLSDAQFRIFSEDGLPLGSWLKASPPAVSSSGIPGRQQYRYRLQMPKIPGSIRLSVQVQDLHGHLLQRVCDSLVETDPSER